MKKSNPDTTCFICNWNKDVHEDDDLHRFWSVTDAFKEAAEIDKRTIVSSTPEARYVDEYRPH